MKLLLDTHALVWWLDDSGNLGRAADAAIRDADSRVMVSAVSAYEIAQKHRLGKMPSATKLAARFEAEVLAEGFSLLGVDAAAARLAGAYEHPHKDPFDRLLVAQALTHELILISNERVFDDFGVARIW